MTKEEMFYKNINLAYKFANMYRMNYPAELEDIKQIALLGLWRAIQTYNGKYALSTYAYAFMRNEINHYLRKVKRNYIREISINTPTADNITIGDMLQDTTDYIQDFLDEEEKTKNTVNVQEIEEKVLQRLDIKNKDREIYRMLKNGKKQKEVAVLFNTSQPHISRVRKKILKEIRNEYEKEKRRYR